MFCGASNSLSGAKHGSAREQTVFLYKILLANDGLALIFCMVYN